MAADQNLFLNYASTGADQPNYLDSTFNFGNFTPDASSGTGFDMGSDWGNFGGFGQGSDSGFDGEMGPNMLGDFSNWANASGTEGDGSFTSPNLANYAATQQESELRRFAKNPIVSFLMGLHPVTAGANAIMRGPTATGGFLGSLIGGQAAGPLGSFIGRGLGQGVGSWAGGAEVSPSSFLPSAGQAGGFLGSMFGAQTGNPYGATLGGFLGSQLGNAAGRGTGATPGINPAASASTEGMGFQGPGVGRTDGLGGNMINESLVGLLPSLLATGASQRAAKTQINNLQQLFAPGSAYAQDMRQQLERRDAAAGRRSQYGNREVELQAKLATLAAAQAPQIQKLYDQRNANRNMMINTALRNPAVQKLMSQGMNSLADMFNKSGGPSLGGTTFEPNLDNMPNYLDSIPWGDFGG